MKIITDRKFNKRFNRLSSQAQKRVEKKIAQFVDNPFAPNLKNHALKGGMEGLRSFRVSFDLRIIYKDMGDHALVLFLDVGGHGAVYR